MTRKSLIIATVVLLGATGVCLGEEGHGEEAYGAGWNIMEQDTLTNNWFGAGEVLEDQGIVISLGLTQVYQINLNGGVSTHRRAGRYQGVYDLEGDFDLQRSRLLREARNCPRGVLQRRNYTLADALAVDSVHLAPRRRK